MTDDDFTESQARKLVTYALGNEDLMTILTAINRHPAQIERGSMEELQMLRIISTFILGARSALRETSRVARSIVANPECSRDDAALLLRFVRVIEKVLVDVGAAEPLQFRQFRPDTDSPRGPS